MDKNQEYIKNVVTLKLDVSKCIGCKMCLDVCPHKVFIVKDKRAKIINKDACMECGACEKNCPTDAITVKSGVGCAAGVIKGIINGTEPTCDCSGDSGSCCG